MESFKDVQPCFDPYFALHKILEIKDVFQVIAQFQCLLEHPVFEYLPAARIYSEEQTELLEPRQGQKHCALELKAETEQLF